MLKPHRSIAALFTLILSSGLVHAQPSSEYRRGIGDTLRYLERSDGTVVMTTPQGPVTLQSEHEAVIALAFGRGDTAWAWYDSLHLAQLGPGQQQQRPATAPVLKDPFVLTISPPGHVTLHRAPAFPPEIAGMTDLTHQFDDFLIALPAEPLAPGVDWADTLVHTHSGRPQDTYRASTVRRFRVLRDTVVAGTPAVLIEVNQDVRIEATSRMEQQGMTASVALEGRSDGVAIFAPATGRLVHRTRSGTLDGELSLTGGQGPMRLPQRYEYTSTIRLLP